MVWKYFYSTQSSGEHGTLYQLRNRLNHTNVVQKPSHDFNSCDDFFELIIISRVIAASLNILGMSNIQDVPSTSLIPEPHMIWMLTNPERKDILNKVSKKVVNNFIDFSFRGPTSATENDDVHKYAKHLLGLGLFYLEFLDAIREGDGSRILRCWRYLLPIFLGSNRTNYSGAHGVFGVLPSQNSRRTPRTFEQL